MFRDLFKKKEPSPQFDYCSALKRLALACGEQNMFDTVFYSVFYNIKRECFEVQFECAMQEYIKGKDKYFHSIRRIEKLRSNDLPKLIEYAIQYALSDEAFASKRDDPTPKGITRNVMNFVRVPHNNSLSRKL